MNLQAAAAIPGVTRISLLLGQVRVELGLIGGPPDFEVKVYQDPRGRCEAIPSHFPVQLMPVPRKAGGSNRPPLTAAARPVAIRPVAQAPGGKPPDPLASRADFVARDQPSPEAALEQTLRSTLQAARAFRSVEWRANPDF
jgi:hypothetical protein